MDKTYSIIARLMSAFVAYDRGMPKQIQHALKVYEFSRLIAEAKSSPRKMV